MQKQLMQRLGELSGKPKTSGLHVHPVMSSERTLVNDLEISIISTELGSGRQMAAINPGQWHTDIAFEPVPADYTSLRLTKLPKTGGGKFES
jgi:alpha-ketoglutarate-dependent taurine dioxygenase